MKLEVPNTAIFAIIVLILGCSCQHIKRKDVKDSVNQSTAFPMDTTLNFTATKDDFVDGLIERAADTCNSWDQYHIIPALLLDNCIDHNRFYWKQYYIPESTRNKIFQRVTNKRFLKYYIEENKELKINEVCLLDEGIPFGDLSNAVLAKNRLSQLENSAISPAISTQKHEK